MIGENIFIVRRCIDWLWMIPRLIPRFDGRFRCSISEELVLCLGHGLDFHSVD